MHVQGDPYGSLPCIHIFSLHLPLSSVCIFIGVIAHIEPNDINEGLSTNFLIPENTAAQIKFLSSSSLLYNRMMQLHFICCFKWFHLGSTAKRAKQCKFWKDFPSICCGQFLNNLSDVVRGFLLHHSFYQFLKGKYEFKSSCHWQLPRNLCTVPGNRMVAIHTTEPVGIAWGRIIYCH